MFHLCKFYLAPSFLVRFLPNLIKEHHLYGSEFCKSGPGSAKKKPGSIRIRNTLP